MESRIKEFLKSKYSKYIFSVILGFGLATLFRNLCKDCISNLAPDLNNIKKNFYDYNGICIKFKTKPQNCSESKTYLNFA